MLESGECSGAELTTFDSIARYPYYPHSTHFKK